MVAGSTSRDSSQVWPTMRTSVLPARGSTWSPRSTSVSRVLQLRSEASLAANTLVHSKPSSSRQTDCQRLPLLQSLVGTRLTEPSGWRTFEYHRSRVYPMSSCSMTGRSALSVCFIMAHQPAEVVASGDYHPRLGLGWSLIAHF